MLTTADVIVATLKASGVRRIYGLPGDSLNGFTDALRRDGEIDWEHVRHEEAAAFAAAGEAAVTGELAVCAASCGPGQPAPDQRALRRQPQPGAGAGDRRAHPARGDRRRLLPGDPPAGAVPRVQRLLRARQRPRAAAARARDRDAPRARAAAASPSSSIPGEIFLHHVERRRAPVGDPARPSRPSRRSERGAARGGRAAERGRARHDPRRRGLRGRARRGRRARRARSRRRSCTRCAARSSSSTTTPTTSA